LINSMTGPRDGTPTITTRRLWKDQAWKEGPTWLARAKFRDFDGTACWVKRSGKTKAAAERELKAALAHRQRPVKRAEITPSTKIEKVAELWLAEVERAVEAGTKSPGTLDTYRSITGATSDPRWAGYG
jgi:hypothetical protein